MDVCECSNVMLIQQILFASSLFTDDRSAYSGRSYKSHNSARSARSGGSTGSKTKYAFNNVMAKASQSIQR
jgi:hypothetical protein